MFIFSTPVFIRHLWQLKTLAFLPWCLIRAVFFRPFSPSFCLSTPLLVSGSLLKINLIQLRQAAHVIYRSVHLLCKLSLLSSLVRLLCWTLITGNPCWRERLSAIDLLLTSSDQLIFNLKYYSLCFKNLPFWGGQLYWAFPFS